jgi:hypothetical protein
VLLERSGASVRVVWRCQSGSGVVERAVHMAPLSGQTAAQAIDALQASLPEARVI